MHIYISPGYFVRGDMSGMRMMQSISVLTHLWTLGVRVRVKLENLGRTKNKLIGISKPSPGQRASSMQSAEQIKMMHLAVAEMEKNSKEAAHGLPPHSNTGS